MKQVVLEKYHCMGNDYLVFDPNKNDLELNAENIKKMCSRHFGIGADGILAGPYLGENDFYVRIYNADGSEAEKSGNGGYFCKISGGRGICAENDRSPGKRWEVRRQSFISTRMRPV